MSNHMELDRDFIDRNDFSTDRHGYDREQVDQHLKEIAAAVEELKRQNSQGSFADSTAYRVQSLLEDAEKSAIRMRAEAEQWAVETTNSAHAEADGKAQTAQRTADERVEGTDSQIAASLGEVENEAAKLRQRTSNTEWRIDQLVADASAAIDEAKGLQSGTSALRDAIQSAQSRLSEIRDAELATSSTQASQTNDTQSNQ
jgi:chromosome segregation ATPase